MFEGEKLGHFWYPNPWLVLTYWNNAHKFENIFMFECGHNLDLSLEIFPDFSSGALFEDFHGNRMGSLILLILINFTWTNKWKKSTLVKTVSQKCLLKINKHCRTQPQPYDQDFGLSMSDPFSIYATKQFGCASKMNTNGKRPKSSCFLYAN